MGKPAFALLAVLACLVPCPAQTAAPTPSSTPAFSLGGQLSLQSSARFDTALAPFFSLRFIPELKFTTASAAHPGRRVIIDAEASVNTYGSAILYGDARPTSTATSSPTGPGSASRPRASRPASVSKRSASARPPSSGP